MFWTARGSFSIIQHVGTAAEARECSFVASVTLGIKFSKRVYAGFPGGAVVKNLPANAGDMGSSPGPRRSHMRRSN